MAAIQHPYRIGFSANAPMMKRINVSDSDSDDEPPPALKFSKVTQALLDGQPLPSPPQKRERENSSSHVHRSISADAGTPLRTSEVRVIRKSPSAALSNSQRGHTPPRILQVGQSKTGSARRTVSIAGPYQQRFAVKREPMPGSEHRPKIVTPTGERPVRVVRTRSASVTSQDGLAPGTRSRSRSPSSLRPRGGTELDDLKHIPVMLNQSISKDQAPDTLSRFATSTTARPRNTSADNGPASIRVKRAPIGTGSFLKSGPVRRGFRRRDSEDGVSPVDGYQSGSASQQSATGFASRERSVTRGDGSRSRAGSASTRATSVEPVSVHDFATTKPHATYETARSPRQVSSHLSRSQVSHESRPPSRQAVQDGVRSRQPSAEPEVRRMPSNPHLSDVVQPLAVRPRKTSRDRGQDGSHPEQKPLVARPALSRQTYRYVPPNVHHDPNSDQENVPPPTFKRNKDQEFKYLGKSTISIMSDDEKDAKLAVHETPVPAPGQQQERRALGAISGNVPQRPAPAPPPKMSVIDTVTTSAGASTTKSRKKRAHMVVNGKCFTNMGKIGKGGSSDVYLVMAENLKTFALKKVKLDDCDENSIRGFKGEIDLLKKLTDVDRVVRLFDWELDEDKQILQVLMEKGDTDLNRILTIKNSSPDAKFDPVFVRYYWREMLECVQAVHNAEIVHSDLKPANFLAVQGRLKLIDFGIANAIDIDNTCNVHRDNHVGTPNYMSPESITDTNAPQPGMARDNGAKASSKKDMRIGKPSDVWSLGCILYQMSYGRPPFAGIQNQISRIMAITNPKHEIEFPQHGIGKAVIPLSLRQLLQRCLDRDPEKRPLIRDMLSEDDAFMNPDRFCAAGGAGGSGRRADAVGIDEATLQKVIQKVVERSRTSNNSTNKAELLPAADEARFLARQFMPSLKDIDRQREIEAGN